MKVVMIHGQNHKGASYSIGNSLVERLPNMELVGEYRLPSDMGEFCIGCYSCLQNGEETCPHSRILAPISKSIEEADLLVFTTPVYCMRTSGSMKVLLDHYFTRWLNHKPKEYMFRKMAVVITVGAGGGMRKAASDIATSLDNWGISRIQRLCVASFAMRWSDVSDKKRLKIDRSIDKLVSKIEALSKRPRVSLGKKFHFYCMRLMHKMNWSLSEDKNYWEKKGWLGVSRPWQARS